MNKIILVSALLIACLITSCCKHAGPPTIQTADAELVSKLSGNTPSGFKPVKPSVPVKAACDSAIDNMKLMRDVRKSNPAKSMADAQHLIFQNINIANPHIQRACVEYDGWFLISRLDTAGHDDGTFKSGIAVKKGTTEIYKWE